jgi:flavin-dependent dehydrogenase
MRTMQDLYLAKKILKQHNFSLVVVKKEKPILKSRFSGIKGLIQAIEKLDKDLEGSAIADKVIGRAAALLLSYSHVKEAYATTLSVEGLKMLKENNIIVEYDKLVPIILDSKRKAICPFEKFSLTIKSPEQAFKYLKEFAENPRKNI